MHAPRFALKHLSPHPRICLRAAVALGLCLGSAAQAVEIKIPDTTLKASLRSSYVYTDKDSGTVSDFALNSLSLYLNSNITKNIKFSFSSEYNSTTQDVQVQDAIAQFEFDPAFNIWAGRFLAPTDRANSYGAYFSDNWNFATDGTQDGYPFIYGGRSDGVAYWGDFADNKLKLSAGMFDIPSTQGKNDNMFAARVQYNFWDAEPGYYLNGTYYGEKDILAIGVATNVVDSKNASNVDFLLEKKVGNGGAATFEAEYIKYDGLGGYNAAFPNGDGYYALAAYLFPQAIGPGKVQLLGKFGTAKFEDGATPDYDQDTTEVNVNYVIKSFNARLSLFYLEKSYSTTTIEDTKAFGLGVQLMTL